MERRLIDKLIDAKDSGMLAGNMDCRILQSKFLSKFFHYDPELIFIANRVSLTKVGYPPQSCN